jgi:hypothetical protein
LALAQSDRLPPGEPAEKLRNRGKPGKFAIWQRDFAEFQRFSAFFGLLFSAERL